MSPKMYFQSWTFMDRRAFGICPDLNLRFDSTTTALQLHFLVCANLRIRSGLCYCVSGPEHTVSVLQRLA